MHWQEMRHRWGTARVSRAVGICLTVAVLTGVWLSVFCAASSAGGWLGVGGGPAHDWLSAWPAPDTAGNLTSITVGQPLQGGPVIDEQGLLYLLTADQLVCMHREGAVIWSVPVGRADSRGLAIGPGPSGAAQIYVATADPRLLRAFTASTGELVWYQFLGTVTLGPPVVNPVTGLVLVGGEDGKLRGYTPAGQKTFEIPMGSQVRSRPAIGPSGTAYVVVRGGALVAVRPNGTELWRKLLGTAASSSAAVGPDERIYFADSSGRAWCLDASGATVYQVTIGEAVSSPAVDAQSRAHYLLADGSVVRLTATGTPAVIATVSSAGLAYGRLALGSCGTVIFAADTHAGAVSPTGTALWHLSLPGPALDVALPSTGLAAIASEDGTVTLVGPWHSPMPPDEPDPPEDDGSGNDGEPCEAPWPPQLWISAELDGGDAWHSAPPAVGVGQASTALWPPGVAVFLDVLVAGETQSTELTVEHRVVTLAVQGEVAVRLRGMDAGGLESAGEWMMMRIDTTAPTLSVNFPQDETDLPLGTALRPEITAADEVSGIAAVEMFLNGVPFVGSCHPGPGAHLLLIKVTDFAGNVSQLTRSFAIQATCSAVCLNPVLSGPMAAIPPWSRWVTVLVRVPVALAATGEPTGVTLAGVPGSLVARLPTLLSSSLRTYLYRFSREDIGHALAQLATGNQTTGRLMLLHVPATWHVGEQACGATLRVLYRP